MTNKELTDAVKKNTTLIEELSHKQAGMDQTIDIMTDLTVSTAFTLKALAEDYLELKNKQKEK